ncbi:scyllo-inositol 2-dehydrogenase (NADP(+)) IolU [bioreactor metagenome]|uniref:Scyllo-inositol 2-dehydrogenase (NADP(+)) IolU n=1 Tax=bioreactor metagenome TaxID=1076179 RepID=A0A645E9Z2_9ZZZZ
MKIGILGTGMISEQFVSAAQEISEIECVAVFNRSQEKADLFKAKYHLAQAFADYEQLLDQQLIDTVYVGLPNSLHYAYAKQAAEHGLNIIIEKPFVSNIQEFDELIRITEERQVKVVEVTRVLSLPNYQVIGEHLSEIGKISLIFLSYCQYSRKYNALLEGGTPNVFSSDFSGGALMDLGVYNIHFIIGLFGIWDKLSYIAKKRDNEVDLSGILLMEYPDFIVSASQSKNSFCDNQIIIQGEKGTISVPGIPSKLDHVYLSDKDQKTLISVEQSRNNFYYALSDILHVFHDDQLYQARLAHSRLVMLTLDQARASAGIVFKADRSDR